MTKWVTRVGIPPSCDEPSTTIAGLDDWLLAVAMDEHDQMRPPCMATHIQAGSDVESIEQPLERIGEAGPAVMREPLC